MAKTPSPLLPDREMKDILPLLEELRFSYSPHTRINIRMGNINASDVQLTTAHLFHSLKNARDINSGYAIGHALDLITQYGHPDTKIADFNAREIDPENPVPHAGNTLIQHAVHLGMPCMVDALVAAGANPDSPGVGQNSPELKPPVLIAKDELHWKTMISLYRNGASVLELKQALTEKPLPDESFWSTDQWLTTIAQAEEHVDELCDPSTPIHAIAKDDLLRAANVERLHDLMKPSRWQDNEAMALHLINDLPRYLQNSLGREQVAMQGAQQKVSHWGGRVTADPKDTSENER